MIIFNILVLPSFLYCEGISWICEEKTEIINNPTISRDYVSFMLKNGNVIIRSLKSGRIFLKAKSKEDYIDSFHFDKTLYMIDSSGRLNFLRPDTIEVCIIDGIHINTAVDIIKNGSRLFYVSKKNRLKIINLNNFKEELNVALKGNVKKIVFLLNGKIAVIYNSKIDLYNPDGHLAYSVNSSFIKNFSRIVLYKNGKNYFILPSKIKLPVKNGLNYKKSKIVMNKKYILIYQGNNLLILDVKKRIRKIKFQEEIASLNIMEDEVIILFKDRTIKKIEIKKFKEIKNIELPFYVKKISEVSNGLLFIGNRKIALYSDNGIRESTPRETVNRTASIFGTKIMELISEKYYFKSLTFDEKNNILYILAQRGEGRERILRFHGFSKKMDEIYLCSQKFDEIIYDNRKIFLIKSGKRGSIVVLFNKFKSSKKIYDGPVDKFNIFGDRLLKLEKKSGIIDEIDKGKKITTFGKILDFTIGNLNSRKRRLFTVEMKKNRQYSLSYDENMKKNDKFKIVDFKSMLKWSSLAGCLVYISGKKNNILAACKRNIGNMKKIISFAENLYEIKKIILENNGMFGYFYLQIKGKKNGLICMFSPIGNFVKNVGLEANFRDFILGKSNSHLFTISVEENKGVLREYFLDGFYDK